MSLSSSFPSAAPESESSGCLARAFTKPDDLDRIALWRGDGVPDPIVALCAAERLLDPIIQARHGRCRSVFVAGAPGCGLADVNRLLLRVTGFAERTLAAPGDDNEQNIAAERIPAFLAADAVSCQHARATLENVRRLREMDVRPVILVRDIFDAIVSVRTGCVRGDLDRSPGHLPPSFREWTDEEQLSFVARTFTPWMLSFVASWQDVASQLPLLWIEHDEVAREPAATVARIAAHVGVDLPADAVDAAGPPSHDDADDDRDRTPPASVLRRAVLEIASVYEGAADFTVLGIGDR